MFANNWMRLFWLGFRNWNFVNGLRSSPRMVQIHFLMRFSDAASNFRLDMCLLKKFFTPKIFLLGFPRRGAIGGYWVSHGKKYKWKIMILAQNRRFLGVFRLFFVIFGHFWPFLAEFGCYMTQYDKFWRILTKNGSKMPIFAYFWSKMTKNRQK